MLSRYDEIWSQEAESHAYEAGQVIKCLITKIQNNRRQYFKNGYSASAVVIHYEEALYQVYARMHVPPYLRRESSEVDEIWYTNTNFDTAEET